MRPRQQGRHCSFAHLLVRSSCRVGASNTSSTDCGPPQLQARTEALMPPGSDRDSQREPLVAIRRTRSRRRARANLLLRYNGTACRVSHAVNLSPPVAVKNDQVADLDLVPGDLGCVVGSRSSSASPARARAIRCARHRWQITRVDLGRSGAKVTVTGVGSAWVRRHGDIMSSDPVFSDGDMLVFARRRGETRTLRRVRAERPRGGGGARPNILMSSKQRELVGSKQHAYRHQAGKAELAALRWWGHTAGHRHVG